MATNETVMRDPGGFVAVLLGSAYLWYAMEIRPPSGYIK